MKRRNFIATALVTSLLPLAATSADIAEYTPGLIETALNEGKTVFVDYSATWCSTCKRQERVINALREANPAYDEGMTFVKVDWDTYSSHDVTTSRDIPRRSTLIVLRGEEELGRIVAGTSEAAIQELMDAGI